MTVRNIRANLEEARNSAWRLLYGEPLPPEQADILRDLLFYLEAAIKQEREHRLWLARAM
jgi:hypothetical protein